MFQNVTLKQTTHLGFDTQRTRSKCGGPQGILGHDDDTMMFVHVKMLLHSRSAGHS